MKPNELPLIAVFNSLRRDHHLPLGVDDYMTVLRALQLGVSITRCQDIEQLCCTVWAKSISEKRLVEQLFKKMWTEITELPSVITHSFQPDDEEQHLDSSPETKSMLPTSASAVGSSDHELSQSTDALPKIESSSSLAIEMNEPVEVVQAIKQGELDSDIELKRPRYSLIRDYFPVTRRQMKQIWRYLRQPVREGALTELDMDSTIQKIGHDGLFFTPVMMPPSSNRANLVMIIDQEGSMIPFHLLSEQLVETVQQSGRLKNPKIFYFHNYPGQYIYRQSALIDHQSIDEMLKEVGEKAVVLIISDGGAARGNYNSERVELTSEWIDQLNKAVRYVAWLNPMPTHCWRKTTAEEIAQLLPMFEMSREGMTAAIEVLRGRYTPWREQRYLRQMGSPKDVRIGKPKLP